MTRDDIIRMAREAGDYLVDKRGREDFIFDCYGIERFAALVISQHVNESRPNVNAEETEWLQQIAYQHGGIGDLASHEFEFGAMVAASEREACAKICDEKAEEWFEMRGWLDDFSNEIAAAIRARGQQ